ncbi:hypothetical protein GCM10027413_24880 [Conyzicola nivalis]|uniref:Uncharacterized protein n=1 Tax=Conyzicola nivalis TaxID=1477021 RepID=A0A916SC38_9MICO|nr:hypothetical protein [Conyzicola nivalis]GGA90694.1 hypothetical protein GCM10010979_01740 [Conyzicola nivalis]
MDIDYPTLFIDGFFQVLTLLATSFGTAFGHNPWPYIGVGALLIVSSALPAKRSRRRRRA